MSPHTLELDEIARRRFGPCFERKCNNPAMIECAAWACQVADKCRLNHEIPPELGNVDMRALLAGMDEKMGAIDEKKKELCAEFRRRMSRLLNEEGRLLGLVEHIEHEIEIFY